MQKELRALLSRYGRIDLLWFDADGNPVPWNQERTYRLVRGLQTEIIVNYGIPYFPNVTMGWDSSPREPGGQVRQLRISVHQHH